MKTSVPRTPRRLALSACAAVALAAPSSAAAAELADLHVEANGRALVPGLSFETGTTNIRTSKFGPGCNGTGDRRRLKGATAMGALIDAAAVRPALRPLRISDEFDFGLLVCGVAKALSSGAGSFWLYKVNHVSPEVGGDQLEIDSGDEVLWYFSDSERGRNTGDELDILAPVRARAGKDLRVRVVSYDAAGRRKPAARAKVSFGRQEVAADRRGVATLRTRGAGELRLRARRGKDIPSPIARVCVAETLRRCSPVRGKRIFGATRRDVLRGTKGPDVINAGGGNDRIDVRGGRRDVVRCGRGRDRVRATRADRVARDCEVVNGKARRRG